MLFFQAFLKTFQQIRVKHLSVNRYEMIGIRCHQGVNNQTFQVFNMKDRIINQKYKIDS